MEALLLIPTLAAIVVVFLVVAFSAVVAMTRGKRQIADAIDVSEEMGLTSLNPEAPWGTPDWYGGEVDGRRFAWASVNVASRSMGRSNAVLSWSLAVEVLRDEPLPGEKRGEFPEEVDKARRAFKKKYGSLRLGNREGMPLGVIERQVFPGRPVVGIVTIRGSANPAKVHALREELIASVILGLESESAVEPG